MINTEIRLIIFFAAKVEKFYTVNKNKTRSWLWLRPWTPYCQIQTEIEESGENHYTIQVWPNSNPLWLYSGVWEKELVRVWNNRLIDYLGSKHILKTVWGIHFMWLMKHFCIKILVTEEHLGDISAKLFCLRIVFMII